MLVLLLISAAIGFIVGAASYAIFGFAAGIFVFICGLPGALIGGFIHCENRYAQDRADYRQMMSDINSDLRFDEGEYRKDIRAAKRKPATQINYDNRQVHLYGSADAKNALAKLNGGSNG